MGEVDLMSLADVLCFGLDYLRVVAFVLVALAAIRKWKG